MTTLLPPSSPVLAAQATPRLSLNAVLDQRGTVDGAWWPRTRDAAAELPALISAIDLRLDRAVLRVGLYLDAWDHIPHRIPAPGRQVRVGWFLSADPHLITLSIAGTAPIALLVIPPGTADGPAMAALALAAAGTIGVRPADMLHPVVPEEGSRGRDGSASWENEGGRIAAPAPASAPAPPATTWS
ncbi:DUF5994 family protein [Spongiactinospora sp. TRM90649]|uniref:DUF5994 family protein n=1 Tax=Spongiactinospora sp. TRM90649 TaxID=3031114 RepID=UPI0023F911CC|nr:DUF5994 family protein [Spongiactinospora sp. TRM90649]MDF5754628.1 DUF5994 family protein [Spongiactinospora sp. TRM90649]